MWKKRLEERYDAEVIAAIHDEVVASVTIEDSVAFIAEMHECMVAPYADMELPVRSSISFGPNFGVQFEASDSPTGPGMLDSFVALQSYLKEHHNDSNEVQSLERVIATLSQGRLNETKT
jgi:hypothetical protein